jgi:hypothetical protein
MKTFKDYLIESSKEYECRLKTVHPLDDTAMKSLEQCIQKYHILDISKPRKTILQDTPLDFPNVQNKEVYIVDFKTALPYSSYVLQQEIRAIWNIPEEYIVIRNFNEPIEIESEKLLADKEINAAAEKKNLIKNSLLSTDPVYPVEEQGMDGSNFYGNEYNNNFLNQLAKVKAERKENRVEPKAPLFSWLEYPKTELEKDGFNDGLSDSTNAVRPVPENKMKNKENVKPAVDAMKTSYGAFENDPMVSKQFVDDKGKKVGISTKLNK